MPSHKYPIQLFMGWVKRLVDLEPTALRQAKYGHCAAQRLCMIFALKIAAACDLSNLAK
jgi:hypothetical protein